MNKEFLQKNIEQDIISRCKNCGADLFEAGSTTQHASPDSHNQEAIHVVCNNCGYIQVLKQRV